MARSFPNEALQLLLHSWEWVEGSAYNTRRVQFSVSGEFTIPSVNTRNNDTLDLTVRLNLLGPGPAGNMHNCQPRQYSDNPQVPQVPQAQQAVQAAVPAVQLPFCCARLNEGQRCYYHTPQGTGQDMIALIRAITGIQLDEVQLRNEVDPCSQHAHRILNLRMGGFTLSLFTESIGTQYLRELDAIRTGMMLRFSKEDRGTPTYNQLMHIIRNSVEGGYSEYIEVLMDRIANFSTTRQAPQLAQRMQNLRLLATTVAADPALSPSYLCAAVPGTPGIVVQPQYREFSIEMLVGLSIFQNRIQEIAGIVHDRNQNMRNALPACVHEALPGFIMYNGEPNPNNIFELDALHAILTDLINEDMFRENHIGTALEGYNQDAVWSDYELATTLVYGRVFVNHDGIVPNNNPMARLNPNNLHNLSDFINEAFHPDNHQMIYDKVRVLLLHDPTVHEITREHFEGRLTVTFAWSPLANEHRVNDRIRPNLNVENLDQFLGLSENVWSFMIQKMIIHNAIGQAMGIHCMDPTLAFVAKCLEERGMIIKRFNFTGRNEREEDEGLDIDRNDFGEDQGFEEDNLEEPPEEPAIRRMEDIIRMRQERVERRQQIPEIAFLQRENRRIRRERLVREIKMNLGIAVPPEPTQFSELMDAIITSMYYRLRNGWGQAFLQGAARKGERIYIDEILVPFQQFCLGRPISLKIAEIGVPPRIIPQWDDAQALLDRRLRRARQRRERGLPPLVRPYKLPQPNEAVIQQQPQRQQQGLCQQPERDRVIIYFAHDTTHYVAVVRNVQGQILNVPNTLDRMPYEAHAVHDLYDILRDHYQNSIFICIIIPFSVEAVKAQYISANRTTFENIIVACPLIIESFGRMYGDEIRLRTMADFAYYALEDPIGGCCCFLNFQNPLGQSPFDYHQFHICEQLIGREKIRAGLCTLLNPLVTYSKVDITKLVENDFEPEKLKVLYKRSHQFQVFLKSVLADLRQLPQWWGLFPTKTSFLEKIRMTQREIETLGIFFKRGHRFAHNVLEDAFVNNAYRAQFEHIGNAQVLENLRNTPVRRWNNNFRQMNEQISLHNRLNGIDTRNLEHPIRKYVSAYPGSVYDVTNSFTAKFLFCHLLTTEVACAIWEGDSVMAEVFGIPDYNLLRANPIPRHQLLFDINSSVNLYSLVHTLHPYMFRTEKASIKLFCGKTQNTLFQDHPQWPHDLELLCPILPPLSRVCYNSSVLYHRHSFKRIRQFNVMVTPAHLQAMITPMDVIDEILLDGPTVDVQEILLTFRNARPANYVTQHNLIGPMDQWAVLAFLPTINQQVGHVEQTENERIWNPEHYNEGRPTAAQVRAYREEQRNIRDNRRRQDAGAQAAGGNQGGVQAGQGGQADQAGGQGGQAAAGNQRGGQHGGQRGGQRGGSCARNQQQQGR